MTVHRRLPTGDGEIHLVEYGDIAAPRVVVFSHGFTTPGFESHRMFISMAERLVAHGFGAVLFDYRGSGYSDKPFDWMTIQTEIADLHVVLDYIRKTNPAAGVGLWGMSLGTAVAAEVAAGRSDVQAVVFWSLSADLHERFSSRYDPKRLAEGCMYLPSGFRVTQQLIDAMATVDVRAAAIKVGAPKLFVHGDQDDQTPIDTAREVAAASQGDTETFFVEGGSHGFKAQPELFTLACERSVEWLQSRL